MDKVERDLKKYLYISKMVYDKYLNENNEQISERKLASVLSVSRDFASKLLYILKNYNELKNFFNVSNMVIENNVSCNELIIADLHIPYFDYNVYNIIKDYIKEKAIKIDYIVILGDLIDFYQISTFTKYPNKVDVKTEIDKTKEFLSVLRNDFENAKIIYKEGNHEYRLEKYILQNAKDIYTLVEDMLQEKLNLCEYNIEYIKEPFKIGKLWHLHGHEIMSSKSSNIDYVLTTLYKNINDNFVVGHFHKSHEKITKKIDGELSFCYAVGHCATRLEYSVINNWTNGFAIVNYDENGNFKAEVHTVYNGIIY